MFLSKPLFGIDIGTRTLKGVRLKKSKGKFFVENYFFDDLMQGNEIFPQESAVAERLGALIELNKFRNSHVSSNLKETDLLSHELSLPEMPHNDLLIAIQNDVEERYSLGPDEAQFDFIKLGVAKREGKSTQLYRVYCIKRSQAIEHAELLKKAGTIPKALESGDLARAAMLHHNGYIEPEKAYIAIDIGESHISLSLIVDEKLTNTHMLPMGLGSVNRTLFDSEGLTYDIAEQIKVHYNLNTLDLDKDQAEPGPLDDQLFDIIYKIQRTIGFIKIRQKAREIEEILVTGGGSQFEGICQVMESTYGIKTQIVNPFKNIEIFDKKRNNDERLGQIAPYMSTAVGLALRGL